MKTIQFKVHWNISKKLLKLEKVRLRYRLVKFSDQNDLISLVCDGDEDTQKLQGSMLSKFFRQTTFCHYSNSKLKPRLSIFIIYNN